MILSQIIKGPAECGDFNFVNLFWLRKRDTITINKHVLWVDAIAFLEFLHGLGNCILNSNSNFFFWISEFDGRPISWGIAINSSTEWKKWLLLHAILVKDVYTHNHCRLIHEGNIRDRPRGSTNFCAHLNKNFVDNWSKIFAGLDCRCEDDLGGDRELHEQLSLAILVEWSSFFLARED